MGKDNLVYLNNRYQLKNSNINNNMFKKNNNRNYDIV